MCHSCFHIIMGKKDISSFLLCLLILGVIYIVSLIYVQCMLHLDKPDFPWGLLWPHPIHTAVKPNKCSVHTYQVYLWLLSCHEVIKPFLEDCVLNCWQSATVCIENKTNITSHVNLLSNCTSKPCLHNKNNQEKVSMIICYMYLSLWY